MEQIARLMSFNELPYDKALELISDCKTTEEAKMLLCQYHEKLAYKIAVKYLDTTVDNAMDNDDIISAALCGLVKAAYSFDETKNVPFSAYSSRVITNEILMVLRHYNTGRSIIVGSIDAIMPGEDEDGVLVIRNMIGEEDSELMDLEVIDAFNRFKETVELTPAEQKYFNARLLLGSEVTHEEIAEYLNCARCYVSRLERSVKNKLKEFMNK